MSIIKATKQIGSYYLVRLECHEFYISFEAIPIFNVLLYGDSDYSSTDPWDEELAYDFRGSLKWDGCINWETNKDCMAHACSLEQVSSVSDVFKSVYAAASEHMLRWHES